MANRVSLRLGCAFAVAMLVALISANPASAAPPVNDNFADATVVGTPAMGSPVSLTNQTTVEATAETNEPNHAGQPATNSIWYSFTPDSSGRFVLYECNTSTKLAVYTGAAVGTLTEVASRSVGTGCSSSNGVQFTAHVGTTYHLVLDTFSETSPITFRLEFVEAGAINDDFADAVAVTNPAVGVPTTLTNQTTVAATPETGEPAHAGFAAANSVWYSLTPSTSGHFAFYICGASTKLAVYTGNAVNALTEVTSGAPGLGCSKSTGVTFAAQSGTNYHLVVDTFSQTTFTFRLELLPDADGDGLIDTEDNCPSLAGPASNGGCPLPVSEPPAQTSVPTFNLAGAISKCKKKFPKGPKRKKCIKKAKGRAQA